jgi:signal transduction histidine kinase/CheY-like chemotaxis protein
VTAVDFSKSFNNYREAAKAHAPLVYVRVGVAAYIAIASYLLNSSIIPVLWFIAVLITQVTIVLVDRHIVLSRPTISRSISIIYSCMLTVNTVVFVSIVLFLINCGSAGELFAVIILCGAMIHLCIHLAAAPTLLIACMTSPTAMLFALPMLINSNDKWALPVLWMAGFLYIAHLVVATINSIRARESLRAVNEVAEQQRRLAEAASSSKSAFLATISHEIRTPLNAVTSAARLLNNIPLSDEGREYVSILLNGSEVLLSLINDVLDMSKIEAGKLSVDIGSISITKIVQNLQALWSPKAAERGLTLNVDLPSDLPAFIRSDSLRLTQILFNLVSNAMKFTSEGGIRIVIGQTPAVNGGIAQLWFEVIDSGMGMTEETMSRLFRNFEQADAGTTRQYGGTGLGLAISRRLAELLGGTLTARSALGIGSTFRLEIPLIEAESTEEIEPADRRAETAIEEKQSALRILLAEDNAVNRRLVELFLQPLGWDLSSVENGADAVEAAELRPFDLILMDMQMPVMSGLDAANAISGGDGPNRKTPIVALTANAFDDQRASWERAGAAGFLTKPINPALMIDTIAKLAANRYENAS